MENLFSFTIQHSKNARLIQAECYFGLESTNGAFDLILSPENVVKSKNSAREASSEGKANEITLFHFKSSNPSTEARMKSVRETLKPYSFNDASNIIDYALYAPYTNCLIFSLTKAFTSSTLRQDIEDLIEQKKKVICLIVEEIDLFSLELPDGVEIANIMGDIKVSLLSLEEKLLDFRKTDENNDNFFNATCIPELNPRSE
jgi:hypothetical protein